MEFLNNWISESLLKALGWTLVHSIWQLILIAAVLWIVLKLAHRAAPSLKYGLTAGALVISFVAGLSTFLYEIDYERAAVNIFQAGDHEAFLQNQPAIHADAELEFSIQKATLWIDQNLSLLVNFWFLGVLLFLFRLVNSLSEIRSLRKSSSLVTDFQLEKILHRLAGKMGIRPNVQLRTTDSGISPLTFDTFKPIILLPAGLLLHLSPAQLEAIIAHELAHVKRNDYLVNLMLSSLEVIFFFHPCYWWMNSTLKELRENAADDLVMKAGIEPKNLATSLAEVLNFAKQNPPELALAAGKKRNPTLQRIKRMLGYPAQNYPQNPIISIPMLLTLLLSAGLIASAKQDTPKPMVPVAPISIEATADAMDAIVSIAGDTTIIKKSAIPESPNSYHFGKNVMVFSGEGYSYRISGDTLISDKDTIIISGKTKVAFEKLREFNSASMPKFDIPIAPMVPMEFEMAPLPDFDEMIPFDAEIFAMEPMIPMVPFDLAMMPPMPPMMFSSDTSKMAKEDQLKWSKDLAEKSKEWAKLAEVKAEEWSKRSEEWAAKWKAGEAERSAKIEAWKKEFEPKMKEFEQKMKEWQSAQEPKMKEFEQKMKEWEATQKPKMEEFQKKMEIWQKEHEAKLQEFQKLIQSELKKGDNN
ncbi:M56 family metallopeptidase [Algoriphagus sp.]|uniref:M56 family metallopeptidase n=1 Tax=Algoriphagus sp. TaxID=1872435 RepID=UPI00391C2AFB